MATKNAIARAWALTPSADGRRYSAYPAGDRPYYFTGFDASENPVSEGGAWVHGAADGLDWNNLQAGSSRAYSSVITGQGGHFDDAIAHLKSSLIAFPADQYVEGVLYQAASYALGHETELLLRFAIAAHSARGYEMFVNTSGGLSIVRWNGPLDDFTVLANTAVAMASGDLYRFEIQGYTLRLYINGALQLSVTDGDTAKRWSSGQPGMGNNPWQVGTTVSSFGWQSFKAAAL